MKWNIYKLFSFLFVTFYISALQAQKFDKKFNKNFKVNKDVVIAINANNVDIDVTTWNRNEVVAEAIITIEGLTKQEAEKYLSNWKFEVLGNKSRLEINAITNKFLHFPENDFTFNIPEINLPDIEFPEINFEDLNIEIPEINIDFDNILDEIDNNYFNGEDDERTFSFISKGKRKTVNITSKEEWTKFKKSKEYQEMKKDIKESLSDAKTKIINKKYLNLNSQKAKIQNAIIDTEKLKEQIEKARLAYKNVDKEKIKASIEQAKSSIEKIKNEYRNSYKTGNNVIVIQDGKNKKEVKITKKIKIKVPKNATYDLNTRHSRVKLPLGEISGKVSYGTFNSEGLSGGKLNISYSTVKIDDLNACSLLLNNVIDAKIMSVSNAVLNSNSSVLKIDNIYEKVEIKNEFGEIMISKIDNDFNKFDLDLTNSNALIDNAEFLLDNLAIKLTTSNIQKAKNGLKFNGNIKIKTKNKRFNVTGNYSSLTLKK